MARTQASTRPAPARSHGPLVWAALGTIYLVWGTTYLGIRVVNESLPPLLAAGVRFLVAGGLMFGFSIVRGDRVGDRPTRAHWRTAVIVGGLLLVGGNGGVVWAEKTIPSGITALIIALIPLWMALIDRIVYGRRLRWTPILGLVTGFGGAALLVTQSARADVDLVGMLFAVGASLCWATGSLYSRHAPLPRRPLVGTGMEMLAGGTFLVAVGIATGELGRAAPAAFTGRSVLALGYLVVFGSLLAFTSYVWLLRNARTSLVSTYAYVNPVVAVLLGAAILDESIGIRTLVAGTIIVGSVALIISAKEVSPPPDLGSGAEATEDPAG
ncbi:MAG TPA: EamA family transporter [Actinomycetota bacterium]|nr:EamA family transporter [Actinomycetota bacterium]